MTVITGVVKNGRIEVAAPPDWPEGCAVVIEPVQAGAMQGMREEDWPTTPDGITALLARMDQREPLEMTPEDEANWQAARKAQKEYELANFEKWAKDIERSFE